MPDDGGHFLEEFSWMAALNSLAKGDATQYDAWLALPANVVYKRMLIGKREADYQRRLHEISNAKR